jgi:hypothetical protein
MCSGENPDNTDLCGTVRTQLITLIKANLNNSGYDFFRRFIKVCSPEMATQSYCQQFKEGD